MNMDDVVKLASDAGMSSLSLVDVGCLERFAALVAQQEREACAKVCDEQAALPECHERAKYCADAIRARGVK